jgi:hypothetical protein
MPQNCTILCPSDEPQKVIACLRELMDDGAHLHLTGKESNWSRIDIATPTASLALSRQVEREPGDSFSKMVLGMHNYFYQAKTSAKAVKAEVLDRVANLALAIGVVAEPEFLEEAGHYDCIFGIAAAMDAIIWTGSGVINAEGRMLLDGDGNCKVV